MLEIKPILISHLDKLIEISLSTFLESHGHSASKDDMDIYIRFSFNSEKIKGELEDKKNIFNFIYFENELAGYSKLIPNFPYEKLEEKNVAKLERIYLKKEFYSKNLGQKLFDYNLNLTVENNQAGIWLYSWVKNERGLNFYKKNGFEIIDEKDFKISANHSNPNYILFKTI